MLGLTILKFKNRTTLSFLAFCCGLGHFDIGWPTYISSHVFFGCVTVYGVMSFPMRVRAIRDAVTDGAYYYLFYMNTVAWGRSGLAVPPPMRSSWGRRYRVPRKLLSVVVSPNWHSLIQVLWTRYHMFCYMGRSSLAGTHMRAWTCFCWLSGLVIKLLCDMAFNITHGRL